MERELDHATPQAKAERFAQGALHTLNERGFVPKHGGQWYEFLHDDGMFMLRSISTSPRRSAGGEMPPMELRFSPNNPKPDVDALLDMAAELSKLHLPQLEQLTLYDDHDGLNVDVPVPPNSSKRLLRIGYDIALKEHHAYVAQENEWIERTLQDFSILPKFRVEEDEYTQGVHEYRFVFDRAHAPEKLEHIAQRITDTLYACEDYESMGGAHQYMKEMREDGEISSGKLREFNNGEIRATPLAGSDREILVTIPNKFLDAHDILHRMANSATQGAQQAR